MSHRGQQYGYYDSSNYSITIERDDTPLYLLDIHRNRVVGGAFSAGLGPRELAEAVALMTEAGFGRWVRPGLERAFNFLCYRPVPYTQRLLAISRLLRDGEIVQRADRGPRLGSHSFNGELFAASPASLLGQRRYTLSMDPDRALPAERHASLKAGSRGGFRLFRTKKLHPELEFAICPYPGARSARSGFSIGVWNGRRFIFDFFVREGRIEQAAFAACLSAPELAEAGARMVEAGFGPWVGNAYGRTALYLAYAPRTDVRKLLAVTRLMRQPRP